MPVEDAMALIGRTFERQVEAKGGAGAGAGTGTDNKHPEDIQTVMGIFSDNRPLSVMEFDKLIKYLCQRREAMLKLEYGDDIPSNLATPPVGPAGDPATKAKQEELRAKILQGRRKERGEISCSACCSYTLDALILELAEDGSFSMID